MNIPGLGSRSRSEPDVFGSLEPEPEYLEKNRSRRRFGKKSGAGAGTACKKSGAGAAKNLPAPPQPWNIL